MTTSPKRWAGDQQAVDALLPTIEQSQDRKGLIALEVVCQNDHVLLQLWSTPSGPVCAYRPTYGDGEVYGALFPDDAAPELVGRRGRDTRHLHVHFLADLPQGLEVWCRCRQVLISAAWLAEQLGQRRNATRRADRRVKAS